MQNRYFISIDWGTTNMRVRLVALPGLAVVEEIKSSVGVKEVFQEWKRCGGNREAFFLTCVHKHIQRLRKPYGKDIQVIISGMISSSIGFRELPYAHIPIGCDGSDFVVEHVTNHEFPYRIAIISGVRSPLDVIRGEEVQVAGLSLRYTFKSDCLVILPGTHSKHVWIESGVIVDFLTFMTGELFDILCRFSVLGAGVTKGKPSQSGLKSFDSGVHDAGNNACLLNELFKVRVNALFDYLSKQDNYYYLSGVLIGEELKSLREQENIQLYVGAEESLLVLYVRALKLMGIDSDRMTTISQGALEESVIHGQYRILTANLNKV